MLSQDITDRVVPWISLVFTILAGSFALYQYVNQLYHNKVSETLKLGGEYRTINEGTSIQSSLRIVQDAGRDVANRVISYYKQPQKSSEAKKKIRQAIIAEWNKEIKSKGYENDIFRGLYFFTDVTLCVDGGACDKDTALLYFGADMFYFVNNFCGYLDDYSSKWNRPPERRIDNEIFRFIFNNDVHKKVVKKKKVVTHREKYFFCEHHRICEDDKKNPNCPLS